MLVRRLKPSPSVVAVLLFCAWFGWHLGFGSGNGGINNEATPERPPPQNERHIPGPPPPPPDPSRIAIVTFITDEKSYIHTSLKNKDYYARRHGYNLIVDYEEHSERGTMYWKYEMMERLIKQEKYDWLWWMDFDTLITNTDIKVADIIQETLANVTKPDDIDYLTTHDCNGLNLGSFILRAHPRTLDFVHAVYGLHAATKDKDDQLSEQDATLQLIEQDEAYAKRTTRVPQWKLNAFPQEIACFDEDKKKWEPGMFILHFAGAWAHVEGEDPTGKLMRKYQDEIVWGDWKEFYAGKP